MYYQDIKTLKFFTNTASGWNETGRIDKCADKKGWTDYKNEIEYVEIGPQMAKVTGNAFAGHLALKEVKLGPNITQIDGGAFTGCENLTTVYRTGTERVEGRMDLSAVKLVNNIISGTKIKEVLLSAQTTEIASALSFGLKTILTPNVTDKLIEYARVNSYNLESTTDPSVKYEYWIEIPEGTIACGDRSAFFFDEATGTLTIYGSGALTDIVNYHGGGSKTSPWFDVKQQIKNVVLSDYITAIGKYNFAQCENLETLMLPDNDDFVIENAAFEGCPSLKSIYRKGNEPIEGTLDLSGVKELKAWTFAYDYLIANVILSPEISKIGNSTFEENINVNLVGIYGTPGSYAEEYAEKNGKTFYDISAGKPAPVTCVAPVITETTEEVTTEPVESETVTETMPVSETEAVTTFPTFVFDDEEGGDSSEEGSSFPVLPVAIGAAAVVIIAVAVIIIIAKKKKK